MPCHTSAGVIGGESSGEVGVSEEANGATFEVPGYQIRRRIGHGGFAVVFEAEQLSLGRAVAVKMLVPGLATERDLRRFERERLLLSDLSRHRHVVDVIDAGTSADGHPFIVMRLYQRGSLAQALADSGPMRPADVVSVVGKLAGALQTAHSLGVVHRDVKPENVLIADDGEPALADFGVSVFAGPGGATTSNFFTMGHVAPEVLLRGEYGVPSDVYALASTAYQLLAGDYAFTAGNKFARMREIIEDPVPPINRPDVPSRLEDVIRRGMAKQPQDRYPSAVALADAMAEALTSAPAGRPFGAPQEALSGASEPTRLLPRRRGMPAGVLVGGVVVLFVLGATFVLGVPPGSTLRSLVSPAPAVVLVSDMSLHDLNGENATNNAIDLYLKSVGGKAGRYTVTLRRYDIASSRWTRWDPDACLSVAQRNLSRAEEVGVIGPLHSGCAKIMVPILSAGSGGPLAMVSNGATDPGLTRSWDVGEPKKYYPSGKRNFARVVTTDDVQGKAAAAFAADDLEVTKVFVVDDGGVYGRHVAETFAEAARAAGVDVVGKQQWEPSAADYRDLFAAAKAAGADGVFLGGTAASHGTRVVKDKVAVLGDNQKVKLLAADGFANSPDIVLLPEAQGMYVTFPGLSPASIRQRGGAGSDFLNAYQKMYGADPEDLYAIYGVAATQVLLAAVRASDGTRAGVYNALFRGAGVTVPKAESVLGADIRIDPVTGDISIKDVTIETIKRNVETVETVVTVS
jgi:branched-chain amino acid transport system substrate-binding protein